MIPKTKSPSKLSILQAAICYMKTLEDALSDVPNIGVSKVNKSNEEGQGMTFYE